MCCYRDGSCKSSKDVGPGEEEGSTLQKHLCVLLIREEEMWVSLGRGPQWLGAGVGWGVACSHLSPWGREGDREAHSAGRAPGRLTTLCPAQHQPEHQWEQAGGWGG